MNMPTDEQSLVYVRKIWSVLLLAAFASWFPATAFSIDLSGECTGILPAGDHVLIGGCTVPAGETLTFESGANLQGASNKIDVSGTVNGSSFTVQTGNFVVQSGGVLHLDQMTYSGIADFISYLGGSSGSVTNSNFNMVDSNSSPHVIQIDAASPNISGNTINANNGVQISGDGANPTIENNIFNFKTVGITFDDASSTGTVNNNTFTFLPEGGVVATAIRVNGDASPTITNNIINDDSQNMDFGIHLAINAGSSVQVTDNTICATNDDAPMILDPDFFAIGSAATISGNILDCGWARGIGLGGTTTADGVLTTIQGQSEFFLQNHLTISPTDTFTINSGKIISHDFKAISANGTLNGSNFAIDNTFVVANAGGTVSLTVNSPRPKVKQSS
jgi:parallel beta-helix repeat protein